MPKPIKISVTDLSPGKVYVTYGTSQQIIWLFREVDKELVMLWHPTTKRIREEIAINTGVGGLFNSKPKVVIIHPVKLEGTKAIKPLTKRGAGGNTVRTNDMRLPTEQFFKVDESSYCFVICCDVNGDLPRAAKKQASSLIGGCYEELDLRQLDYGDPSLTGEMLPMSALAGKPDVTVVGDYYRDIINDLLTLEGVQRWGEFNKSTFFKLFLIPGFKYPPLLSKANALCLLPYVEPFIKKVVASSHCDNSHVLMQEFAYWVFCCNNYWNETSSEGLTTYNFKDKNYYSFRPSTKAKILWHRIVESLGL